MNPKWSLTVAAALVAGVVLPSPAPAQLLVTELPALYRGPFTCAAKFPGSFLDLGTAACWQCPSTHPRRTIFAVTAGNACERPAQTLYRKAYGPENPTGWLGTDCRSGWFLHWDKKCYSCGSGYSRTADPNIASTKACVRVVPPAWTSATKRGVEGCPAGAFRNALTANCYACPPDYSRNAVVADDLTKVNACTKVAVGVHDETRAKFEAAKDTYIQTRDELGRIAASMAVRDPALAGFDAAGRTVIKELVDGSLMYQNGFDAASMVISVGAAAVVGYSHLYGYVMTKVNGVHQCRKIWANTFSAGASLGGGAVIEIALSKGVSAVPSETNGFQILAAYPPVSGGWSLGWDATTGALNSSAYSFGPGFSLEVNGEYVHSWEETGKVVACDKLTWGGGWATL